MSSGGCVGEGRGEIWVDRGSERFAGKEGDGICRGEGEGVELEMVTRREMGGIVAVAGGSAVREEVGAAEVGKGKGRGQKSGMVSR